MYHQHVSTNVGSHNNELLAGLSQHAWQTPQPPACLGCSSGRLGVSVPHVVPVGPCFTKSNRQPPTHTHTDTYVLFPLFDVRDSRIYSVFQLYRICHSIVQASFTSRLNNPEKNQKPGGKLLSRILFSTISNWKSYYTLHINPNAPTNFLNVTLKKQ